MNKDDIHKILTEKKVELKERFGVTRIGLFGSYVRNEESHESDMDFVVELEAPELILISSLKNYLQDIFKNDVDIVRLRKNMNESLRKRIQDEAIYV